MDAIVANWYQENKETYSSDPLIVKWQKAAEVNDFSKIQEFVDKKKLVTPEGSNAHTALLFLSTFRKGVDPHILLIASTLFTNDSENEQYKNFISAFDRRVRNLKQGWTWMYRLLHKGFEQKEMESFKRLFESGFQIKIDLKQLENGGNGEENVEAFSDDKLDCELKACNTERELLEQLVDSRTTLLTLRTALQQKEDEVENMRKEAADRIVAFEVYRKHQKHESVKLGGVSDEEDNLEDEDSATDDLKGVEKGCADGIRKLRRAIEAVDAKHRAIEENIKKVKKLVKPQKLADMMPYLLEQLHENPTPSSPRPSVIEKQLTVIKKATEVKKKNQSRCLTPRGAF